MDSDRVFEGEQRGLRVSFMLITFIIINYCQQKNSNFNSAFCFASLSVSLFLSQT